MKGHMSIKQKNKLSKARKNWLKKVDKKILNKIYRKISSTKRKKYASGKLTPWNKGKKIPPFSKEWRENLSNALKGRKCPKNVIISLRKRNKINNPMWDPIVNAKVNKNPEYIKKRINSLIKKPNKKEKILLNLINKNNLPYNYVGDGKKIIGSKNPDFIDEPNKKIIELFWDYWHTTRVRCYEETEKGRIEYFKKYGYDTLVVWEWELNNINKLLEKIKDFNQN